MARDESLLAMYMAVSGAIFLAGAVGAALLVWAFSRPYNHAALEYQGSERCAECHEEQIELWQESHMAQSFAVLRAGERVESKRRAGLDPEADYTRDSQCLHCHTTGLGLVGGFTSIEETPEMAGVSCEACHGPGGRYIGTGLSPHHGAFETARRIPSDDFHTPDDAVCRSCHSGESPFARSAEHFRG